MYMPLTMISMRLPSKAGIRPLKSIGMMVDCRPSFFATRRQVDIETGGLAVLGNSKGGKVTEAPQVSLPGSTSSGA